MDECFQHEGAAAESEGDTTEMTFNSKSMFSFFLPDDGGWECVPAALVMPTSLPVWRS